MPLLLMTVIVRAIRSTHNTRNGTFIRQRDSTLPILVTVLVATIDGFIHRMFLKPPGASSTTTIRGIFCDFAALSHSGGY